jgi:hypothetical protein
MKVKRIGFGFEEGDDAGDEGGDEKNLHEVTEVGEVIFDQEELKLMMTHRLHHAAAWDRAYQSGRCIDSPGIVSFCLGPTLDWKTQRLRSRYSGRTFQENA